MTRIEIEASGGGRKRDQRRPALLSAATFVAAVLALAVAPPAASAQTFHKSSGAFLGAAFGGAAPEARVLWLRGPIRAGVDEILGHPYRGLRVRYWARDRRTAWILDEIGKYKPITAGIVVDGDRIDHVEVLAYRESHGWEVRHPFFTDRFRGAGLDGDGALSRSIDGISGATLSVNAVTRLVRLALFLHRQVRDGAAETR